jgi:hypothetical protein
MGQISSQIDCFASLLRNCHCEPPFFGGVAVSTIVGDRQAVQFTARAKNALLAMTGSFKIELRSGAVELLAMTVLF